ncbi:MAG: hypothetical protein HY402_03925 [Elusimicrobia bacterium]|nr:hypothetical protein [Elusimicrobiota bacterium]
MYILGISCFYHDSAAALLKDGELLAACQEERFTRRKHDHDFPKNAVRFCLKTAGIAAQDLNYVVFYEKPFRKFERILATFLKTAPRSWRSFPHAMAAWLGEKIWIRQILEEHLQIPKERILFAEHHLSHAASAFFCSPFTEAAILTADGVGEWISAAYGVAQDQNGPSGKNAIHLSAELRFPHSVGLLYSALTAYLGFEVNEGEYKVMGMAPYGNPRYYQEIQRLFRLFSDGSLELDLSYFRFHRDPQRSFSRKLEDLLGPPRNPGSRFVTSQTSTYDDPIPPSAQELLENQRFADIAASLQQATEEILLKMARHVHQVTGKKYLCLAGGVALNSSANYRLLKESPFEDIFVQPAAGDAGGALGAALYAYHVWLQKPRRFTMEHAYWGEEFSPDVLRGALKEAGLPYREASHLEELLEQTVQWIQAGKVIGWYQGKSEWGPRALGNRSILADPTQQRMKDKVNILIKFREPFRPFAPSIAEERVTEFCQIPKNPRTYPSRFMLLVTPVVPAQKNRIPAVTHVDGTARVQAVASKTHPLYHRLLERFAQASGVPVILNTSFNLKGEPIVHTPKDAIGTFLKSGLEALVLGNFLVAKNK